MQKTLGGDRIGSGSRMKVNLHGYERSTHNLGYLWRSTMSAGTLVPFMSEVALPGDTFDINLGCEIQTHPTVGPLFGSFKVQLDVYQCPIRLYQAMLHNNKLNIGMNMAQVKLPVITLFADPEAEIPDENPDNAQINPSCILSYLGIRGVGTPDEAGVGLQSREFNAVPLLSYWDIVKNYYSNKQEEYGWVIHEERVALVETVDDIRMGGVTLTQGGTTPHAAGTNGTTMTINYTGARPILSQILLTAETGLKYSLEVAIRITSETTGIINGYWNEQRMEKQIINGWDYLKVGDIPIQAPTPTMFELDNIDQMREQILQHIGPNAFNVHTQSITPYSMLLNWNPAVQGSPYQNGQEGLALKTYQSDLFNNWLNEEWIEGSNGITEITAIDTTGGFFTIDTLNLSKKVYDMLNRIAVSGGTYDDWLDAVYTHDRYMRAETPMYMGGLIKELVFQEVISNSQSSVTNEADGQPLGTLGGRGVMASRHKGGHIRVKVDEPSYIIGIVSLTPRIDYSQGNKWDIHLKTMDDLHKPALDEIGFQDLITEQMAWWSTTQEGEEGTWLQKSAGKQPAWINYMTNVNQTRGNFAIEDNEMFMTLNRRYEKTGIGGIADLTTYIDPTKFNNIFADTSIDAQNFWTQISVDITARRKMSAKIMPNL